MATKTTKPKSNRKTSFSRHSLGSESADALTSLTRLANKEKSPETVNLDATVYSPLGKSAGSVKLPASIFGLKWNADLVHQVVTAMQANARSPWAHAKDRSEVRGGGKKPWRQKGTGRARHGSSRSPIWRHGGVTHGPRKDKDYSQKVNRKMRVKALYTILSKSYADGKIIFLSDLPFQEPKTKNARTLLTVLGGISGHETLASRRRNALYVVLPDSDTNIKKSFRNMSNVLVGTASALNPVDALSYQRLLIVSPERSVKVVEARNK
ncbi:MAG: 50S ribosomal protein L4 [bacterium]|nr:50S ribosomal protein L4 [bacterium]